MRVYFDLTWAQARQHDYFLLTAKHVIREKSDKVHAVNMDYADKLPAHHVTEYGEFKVRGKLFVGKIKPYHDRIWSMEFCEGFVVRQEAVNETLAGFSGAQEAQVFHYRTKEAIPGWSAFCSDCWLPRLTQDETTYITQNKYSKYISTHGLYAAEPEDLNAMPDIFRMPQVYNKFGDSPYFVRKSVMEFWHDMGIEKSFFLHPLLMAGTKAHDEYLDLWRQMNAALSANPRNRIA